MGTRPRDSQRAKLYNAERIICAGQRFDHVNDVQTYVNKITNSRWWSVNFPLAPKYIRVRDGRGRRSACAERHAPIIKLPRWARTEFTILHELAHITLNGKNVPDHGREFARILLSMVGRWMGNNTKKSLRASYKEYGVKYCKQKSKH